MRITLILPSVCCLAFSSVAIGQAAGADWQRVQQLPAHTRVHVSSDKMSRVCSIDTVDDQQLTCSASRMVSTSHFTFPRSEVKSIKVTRYGVSTAGGAAIGAGAGLIVGVAGAHGGNNSLSIVSNQAIWGVTALAGAVVGAVIGYPTDFLRGPTVYRRP